MKSCKGFNLFTALIALMLVSITIVFVYNMVQTEENYLALIDNQSKSSDLLTIADLSRADAFNVFVVSFRERWAEHRSSESNYIQLTRNVVTLDWNSFVDYYANYIFFDNQFANYFGLMVTDSLSYQNPPVGYSINVPDYNREDLSRIIKIAFDDADEKITVIDCEDNFNCLGTLYFTIDTRKLSAQDYEKLPMIVINRLSDNEVIQRPVFARREYRIYLPWKGFQALRSVRNFALSPSVENAITKDEIVNDLPSSTGFFNPNIHYALNSAKLGVCDIGSCGLRTDLFKTADKDGFEDRCDAPPETEIDVSSIFANSTNVTISKSYNYNLTDSSNINDIFLDLVKTTVTNNLNSRNSEIINSGKETKKLEVEGNIGQGDFKIYDVRALNNSLITKWTKEATSNTDRFVNSISPTSFSINTFNKASNLNFEIDINNNYNIVSENSPFELTTSNQNLRCHNLEQIRLVFKFEETNPQYIVTDQGTFTYVHLLDDFSRYSFYGPDIANFANNRGYFNSVMEDYVSSLNRNNKDWYCGDYDHGIESAVCIAESP